MKKLEVSGITFDLAERYEPIKLIGKGTYGAVISATDHLTKTKVAIKKLCKIDDMVRTNALDHADRREARAPGDKDHEGPQAREHPRALQRHVHAKGRVRPWPSCFREVLGDIYLVSELMETDLNRVIKSKQKLKVEHIQYFLY